MAFTLPSQSPAQVRATQEAIALCVELHIPIMLWGEPGTGKTSTVQSVVQAIRSQYDWDEDDFPFETLIASVHDPADFGGFPSPDHDSGLVRRLPIDWAKTVAGKRGLVFFDEFSTAAPAIQAACLRVLEEKVVGPLDLGAQVSFMLAGNPMHSAAGGWEFSAATSRRFVHLNWNPGSEYMIDGFINGFPAVSLPDLTKIRLDATEFEGYSKLRKEFVVAPDAKGAVVGFLSANPAALLDVPTDPSKASGPWCNPAAWDRMQIILSAVEVSGASDEARDLLIMGNVGEGIAHEFIAYMNYSDLPNTEEIIANPGSFSFKDLTGDKVFRVLGNVATAIAQNNSVERWSNAWELVDNAADSHTIGHASFAARSLAMNRPSNNATTDKVRRFIPMLKEAGLL